MVWEAIGGMGGYGRHARLPPKLFIFYIMCVCVCVRVCVRVCVFIHMK